MPGAARVFLTDFGLAKEVAGPAHGLSHSNITQSGSTLGTPHYMSPEQARGELGGLTPASDVWALGCVLYESLAGRPPFEGDTPAAVVGAILTTSPAAAFGVPPAVQALLAVCLEKAATDRPAHGAALRDACEDAVRGIAVRRGRWRTPALLWLGGAAALALGAAAVAGRGGMRRPLPQRAPASPGARDFAQGQALQRSDPDRAAAAFARAVAAEPGRTAWRVEWGLTLWAAKRGAEAEAVWAAVPAGTAEGRAARFWIGLRTLVEFRGGVPTSDFAAAAQGTDRIARLADAALRYLGDDVAGAVQALEGIEGWEVDVLRVLVLGKHDREAETHLTAYERALRSGMPMPLLSLNFANRLYRLRDYPGTLTAVERALQRSPDHFDLRELRARVLVDLERNDEALTACDALATERPDDPALWMIRGRVFMGHRDDTAAEAAFTRVLAADPDSVATWFNLGTIRVRQERPLEALDAFTRALELHPRYLNALIWRTQVHNQLGRWTAALADADAALALDDSLVSTRFIRARALQELGRADAAMAEYAAVLRVNPESRRAYFNRSQIRWHSGDTTGAESELDEALRIDERYVGARINRAALRKGRGDLAGALADLEVVAAVEPDHRMAVNNRAEVLQVLGRAAEAMAVLREHLARDGAHGEAWLRLARLCADQGDHPATRAAAESGLACETDPARRRTLEGLAAWARGQ